MKWILGMAVGLVLLVPAAWGGNIDSPGTSPLDGSGLYPLQALYDYLDSGAAPGLPTTFQGPTAAPGSTGKTTNEIYEHIRGMFEVCDVTPDDVVDTATFFNTDPANWGPRQGAMTTRTLDPGTKDQLSGFYDAFDLSEVDADLKAENIKSGATIFGISGDSNVVDTSSGDAAAGDILPGKKAWVDGLEVTGSLATQTPDSGTVNQAAGLYDAFDLSAVDPDLNTGNIRSGATVFGVPGDPNVVDTSSGDAAAGEILSGKKAWVQGAEVTGALATRTPDAETVDQAAGIYEAFNLSAVDTDLNPDNIRAGTTIFGISGSETVVDTAETTSPATAEQILEGRRAFVEGTAVTGTMPIQTLSDATAAVPGGYYTETNLISVDPDLATENIKSGTTVFGVPGDPNVVDTSSGDAAAVEISSGKIAWVDGLEITGTAYPAPVAKTGQTTGYYAGDDGVLEKGVNWPIPRFTDNGNGTVTDNLTGLIWLQNGSCSGELSWTVALLFCNDLAHGQCGLEDDSEAGNWRLPNIKELLSLIDYGRRDPAMPAGGDPFTVISSAYWSSTSHAGTTSDNEAWTVNFFQGNDGTANKHVEFRYVRAVRGGQ